MMDGVDRGEVKCVVVKDLPRIGMNYLQVGMFTEITFSKKCVRFIAINDGVNSAQFNFPKKFIQWQPRIKQTITSTVRRTLKN